MKLKALLLTSSLILASTAFAATTSSSQDSLIKSIHFTINNETGASIKYFDACTDGLTPLYLDTSLPTGKSDFVFNVDKNDGSTISLAAKEHAHDKKNGAVIMTGVNLQPYSDPSNDCQGFGNLAANCTTFVTENPTTYNVVVDITNKS